MALPGAGVRSSYASLTGTSSADLDAAYARAVQGNAPADFNFILDVANGKGDPNDVQKAINGVNDLMARGWYGGTRSGQYLNDNYSTTVNHGQPLQPQSTVQAPGLTTAPVVGNPGPSIIAKGSPLPWILALGAAVAAVAVLG